MKMERKIKRTYIVLFCIYLAAVILLCVIKTDNLPELPKSFLGIPLDKLTHFAMFLPFTILGYGAFHPTTDGFWRKVVVLSILLLCGCVFTFATERLQALTSYRSYELLDMAADGSGLLAGALATLIFIATKRK